MRYAILADIHGNATALTAVMEDAKRYEVDAYILLGDYVDAGPHPRQVYDMIAGLTPYAVVGDHDLDLLREAARTPSKTNGSYLLHSLQWTAAQLNEDMADFLRGLPGEMTMGIQSYSAHLSHGDTILKTTNSADNLAEIERFCQHAAERVYLLGHTHRPFQVMKQGKHFINPGSVGLSFSQRAEYALMDIDDTHITIENREIAYDINSVLEDFWSSGFIESGGICAELNALLLRTGKDHSESFKTFALGYAQSAYGVSPNDISDDLWKEAFERWKTPHGVLSRATIA